MGIKTWTFIQWNRSFDHAQRRHRQEKGHQGHATVQKGTIITILYTIMTIIPKRRKSTYNNSNLLVVLIDHAQVKPFPPFYNHLRYLQNEVHLRPEPMNLLHSYFYGCVTPLVMLHDAIIDFPSPRFIVPRPIH
jgi:hypothetical protein